MKNSNEIRCILIRHGSTKGNLEHRYTGCRTDEPLCAEGRAEMQRLRNTLLKEKRQFLVFSGPMKRTIESAKILFPDHEPETADDLREIDFGGLEGKTYEELKADSFYQKWIDSGGVLPFPNGESRDGFINRSVRSFSKLILKNRSAEKTLVFVCHGGSIMAVMSSLTGADYYDFQVKNGEGYEVRLRITGETIDVISYRSLFDRLSDGSDHRGPAEAVSSDPSDRAPDTMA